MRATSAAQLPFNCVVHPPVSSATPIELAPLYRTGIEKILSDVNIATICADVSTLAVDFVNARMTDGTKPKSVVPMTTETSRPARKTKLNARQAKKAARKQGKVKAVRRNSEPVVTKAAVQAKTPIYSDQRCPEDVSQAEVQHMVDSGELRVVHCKRRVSRRRRENVVMLYSEEYFNYWNEKALPSQKLVCQLQRPEEYYIARGETPPTGVYRLVRVTEKETIQIGNLEISLGRRKERLVWAPVGVDASVKAEGLRRQSLYDLRHNKDYGTKVHDLAEARARRSAGESSSTQVESYNMTTPDESPKEVSGSIVTTVTEEPGSVIAAKVVSNHTSRMKIRYVEVHSSGQNGRYDLLPATHTGSLIDQYINQLEEQRKQDGLLCFAKQYRELTLVDADGEQLLPKQETTKSAAQQTFEASHSSWPNLLTKKQRWEEFGKVKEQERAEAKRDEITKQIAMRKRINAGRKVAASALRENWYKAYRKDAEEGARYEQWLEDRASVPCMVAERHRYERWLMTRAPAGNIPGWQSLLTADDVRYTQWLANNEQYHTAHDWSVRASEIQKDTVSKASPESKVADVLSRFKERCESKGTSEKADVNSTDYRPDLSDPDGIVYTQEQLIVKDITAASTEPAATSNDEFLLRNSFRNGVLKEGMKNISSLFKANDDHGGLLTPSYMNTA